MYYLHFLLAALAAVVMGNMAVFEPTCVDMDNAHPARARYGHVSWRPSSHPNCRTEYPLDGQGECFSHLGVQNECKAFCKTVSGWYFGNPIDLMGLQMCDRGEDCGRSFSYSETLGKSSSQSAQKGITETTTQSNTFSIGVSLSLSQRWSRSDVLPDGFLGSKWTNETSISISTDLGWRMDFGKTVAKSRSYSISNSTSFTVAISKGENYAKPAYAKDYCGSWFAVPHVGVDCGRGAAGKLTGRNQCLLDPRYSAFGHCFDYTFKDTRKIDDSIYQMVFVLRDCQDGFILPGEWQQPAFQQSFDLQSLVNHHLNRFGFDQLPKLEKQPHQELNIADLANKAHTRTLGPDDYTVEICGRGQYCARHKLKDQSCYTFPRGHLGPKSAFVVSAKTSPGNCCVLFSKPECYGLPQLIRGAIDDFSPAGYKGQAHSVVCNVDEYCNPNRLDSISAMA